MDFIQEIYKLDGSYDDLEDIECSPIHRDLTYRMKKTLYAGDKTEADSNGIPLPLADIVTELFQTADQPTITLAQRHVGNITKRAHVTQCSTFLGLLYARRLKQHNPEFIKRVNSTELFLVSMMLATKFLYDEGEDEEFFNDEWANVGKLDVKRVHELEREFLDALDWNLFVEPQEFFEFLQAIETRIALNQGGKRGWFSYTDLLVLMNTSEWYQVFLDVLQQSVKVVSVCAVVYSLCAATMLWSGLLLHHTQVPLRPCQGRLQLPFGLQHSKTTLPWQPNPLIDQLLYTFLMRLPVNSDPLGLAYNHASTWCSLPPVKAGNDDGNDDDSTILGDSNMDIETRYQNGSMNHHGMEHLDKTEELHVDDDLTDETKDVIARTSTIQDALVIFYHALLSALWEVKEVSHDAPSTDQTNLDDVNGIGDAEELNQMTPRGHNRSCPFRNMKQKSSKLDHTNGTHGSIFSNKLELGNGHIQCVHKHMQPHRRWDSHGMSGNTGFMKHSHDSHMGSQDDHMGSHDDHMGSHDGHMGFMWQINNTAQQCIIGNAKDPPLLPVY